jgi:hypothetical protein
MVSGEHVLVRGNTFGDILVSQGNTFWGCQWGKEEKRRGKKSEKKRGKWSVQEISGDYYKKLAKKY